MCKPSLAHFVISLRIRCLSHYRRLKGAFGVAAAAQGEGPHACGTLCRGTQCDCPRKQHSSRLAGCQKAATSCEKSAAAKALLAVLKVRHHG